MRVAQDAVVQVLGNLLDNACKYSPDGEPVRLSGTREGAEAVLAPRSVIEQRPGVDREVALRVVGRDARRQRRQQIDRLTRAQQLDRNHAARELHQLLAASSLLASYVPARRATRLDPVAALRGD